MSQSVNAACTVTDDAGTLIHLNQAAKRIISLAPDITENLFAIGAGDHLVGVVSGSDYPEKARRILQVGSYRGLDLERIISLHPDLIVTWRYAFSRQLAILKKAGIPIYMTEPRKLEDIPKTMQSLGCLTATAKQAKQAARAYSNRLLALKKQYQTPQHLSVFYQIGAYSLFTINKDSWINQALNLCGGKNIFANAKTVSPAVSLEAVVLANPDVIISDAEKTNWQKRWAAWPSISAVKHHALFTVSPDLVDRAGPRLLEGVVQVCESLQRARRAFPVIPS